MSIPEFKFETQEEYIAQMRQWLSAADMTIGEQRAKIERLQAALADVREVLHDTDLSVRDRANNAITVVALALDRKP